MGSSRTRRGRTRLRRGFGGQAGVGPFDKLRASDPGYKLLPVTGETAFCVSGY